MKIKATTLRGTIFTQRIPLDNNTLQKILPLFDGYAVEMVPAGPEGPFPTMAFNWSLKSSKEDCRIVFGNATIDIIKNVNTESISDAITAFSIFCQTSFENIFAKFGNPVSRMALATSLKVDLENEDEFVELTKSIASAKNFKDTPISTLSFTDVYRVDDKLCGQDVKFNFLSSFNTTEDLNTKSKDVVFSADINTYHGVPYNFDNTHLHEFYQKVAGWFDEFYTFYFKNCK